MASGRPLRSVAGTSGGIEGDEGPGAGSLALPVAGTGDPILAATDRAVMTKPHDPGPPGGQTGDSTGGCPCDCPGACRTRRQSGPGSRGAAAGGSEVRGTPRIGERSGAPGARAARRGRPRPPRRRGAGVVRRRVRRRDRRLRRARAARRERARGRRARPPPALHSGRWGWGASTLEGVLYVARADDPQCHRGVVVRVEASPFAPRRSCSGTSRAVPATARPSPGGTSGNSASCGTATGRPAST
jgi:hypothetical protein